MAHPTPASTVWFTSQVPATELIRYVFKFSRFPKMCHVREIYAMHLRCVRCVRCVCILCPGKFALVLLDDDN